MRLRPVPPACPPSASRCHRLRRVLVASSMALMACGTATASGSQLVASPGLRVIRVLGPATARLRKVRPGLGLSGTLAKGILITSGSRLYEVRRGAWIGEWDRHPLVGLALLGDEVLVIRRRQLLSLRGDRFVPLAELPEPGMRLVAAGDADALYAFGGGAGGRSIYRISRLGEVERLVRADVAVTALAEAGGEVLFALGPEIYLLSRRGSPALLYRGAEPVLALELDPDQGIPFFATPSGVFALSGIQPIALLVGISGILHHDGRHLLVSDPVSRALVAIEGPATWLGGTAAATSAARPGVPRARGRLGFLR